MTARLMQIGLCIPGGALSGFLGCLWARRLLKERNKEYLITPEKERLLILAAALGGGIYGLFTKGMIFTIYGLILLAIGITVSITDWTNRIIPNQTVLAIFAVKLIFGIPYLLGMEGFPVLNPLGSLGGMIGCFLIFLAPSFMGRKVGAGDVKVAAAVGFLLGFYGALIAIVIMGFMVLGYSVFQRRVPMLMFLKTFIPMGPFIMAGMFISLLQICMTL